MNLKTPEIKDRLFVGMDIGSVNVHTAAVTDYGELVYLDSERLAKGSARAVIALLERMSGKIEPEQIFGAGVTGSGRELYSGQPGWQEFSSPYAAINGVLWDEPEAKTIIAIGGQSLLVIGLPDGLKKPWRVTRSPLCAAGTGRFLEQQAARLGIPIEDFGAGAFEWKKSPPRIAARCSVFAKSDLVHLQQKGVPVSAMLAGLSDSVARMIVAQWRDKFEPPIFFVGGVAKNVGVVRALEETIHQPINVPVEPVVRQAIGVALLARNSSERPVSLQPVNRESDLHIIPRRLQPTSSPDSWSSVRINGRTIKAALGVDVGSISTKAAIIDVNDEVLFKTYLMTTGQPLEAVKQVMRNLDKMTGGRVYVEAVGVTGSGRYLVGHFIGADLIKNEITAQTKAALCIDPAVDTIFEIGGQDSKYIYLKNGTVLDSQMNKACAAGTGSFIDEIAEQLGVSTRNGEFAQRAFAALGQLDLGEKCAAFMSQAVTVAQHAGVSLDVIVASLSVSLAKNYRSKVVGMRHVGDRIFLTGAVFYNDAAVSAFHAEFPGKVFVVPVHKEVTGAIGAALLAREAQPAGISSKFKGFSSLAEAAYKMTNFTCYHCENLCEISMMTTEDSNRLFYGSRCDRYDATGVHKDQQKRATPFTTRESLLFGALNARSNHG